MTVRFDYPAALTGRPMDIGPDRTRFYWRSAQERAPAVLTAQDDFAKPRLTGNQKLLKQSRQRFIFRHSAGGTAYVIKLFPLSFIGSKLRHPKYAYREFSNTVNAQSLGISVPNPVAFLEKRSGGLVCCSGIVQECLDDHTDLLTLHRQGDMTFDRIPSVAAPVLAQMFEAGANHVDLRDENIMLNRATGETRVIDWQYASFTAPRAPWLLEYLLAYFIKLAPEPARAELISTLPAAALAACTHPLGAPDLIRRIEALLQSRMKLKQRLALQPVQGT